MTWPFSERASKLTAQDLLAERAGFRGNSRTRVSREQSLSHSAVWAGLRLRADLISCMPVDVFRRVGGVQVEQKKPPVLITPGGSKVRWTEWAYSTQIDLDSCGNTFGIITAVDGLGMPARIELVNADDVVLRGKGSQVTEVRIAGEKYDYAQLWHEKQFTMSGLPVGLSPIAYAAMTLGGYLSAQQFAADWFGNSAVPASWLKNTNKTLDPTQSAKVKERFKASVSSGDVFVTGADWEYSVIAAKASESQFLETMKFSVSDACRFIGVPGDLIDAESSTGHVTYANITQRNLQLLIMNIGPAVTRREDAFSAGLVSGERYVKLNPGALLRMDLKSRYESYGTAIDKRFMVPSEARDLENLPPFTPEQEAEFTRLFPKTTPTLVPPTGGN